MGQSMSMAGRHMIHGMTLLTAVLCYFKPEYRTDFLAGIFAGFSLSKLLSGTNPQALPVSRNGILIIHGLRFISAFLCYCRPEYKASVFCVIFPVLTLSEMLCGILKRRRPVSIDPLSNLSRDLKSSTLRAAVKDSSSWQIPSSRQEPTYPQKLSSRQEPTYPQKLYSRQSRHSHVGIFSRSGEEEYSWLTEKLEGRFTVQHFFISNTNWRAFMEFVPKCDFAVLYHSKNRGRVNITDVTDSLYDQELAHMSERLGKNRVIVVVDDLDDSSLSTKRKIIENQPSIGSLARNIFLFSKTDKGNEGNITQKVNEIQQTMLEA